MYPVRGDATSQMLAEPLEHMINNSYNGFPSFFNIPTTLRDNDVKNVQHLKLHASGVSHTQWSHSHQADKGRLPVKTTVYILDQIKNTEGGMDEN